MIKFRIYNSNSLIYIVATIIYILIPACFTIVSSSIDDYFYMALTSGSYTGTPTPYTVFIGYIYSSVLSGLYRFFPFYEWYAIGHFVLMYIAFVTFIFLIIKNVHDKYVRWVSFMAVLAIQSYFEIRPHFANVTIELSMAATLLLLYSQTKKTTIIAAILFFLSTQLRFEAALISVPILCILFLFKHMNRAEISSFAFKGCMFLSVLLISLLGNLYMYHTPEWSTYQKEKAIRCYIVDHPNRSSVYDIIDTQHERDTYQLMEEYRMMDPKGMDLSLFSQYVQFLKEQKLRTAYSQIRPYYDVYKAIGVWWVALLCFIVFIAFAFEKEKSSNIVFWSALFFFFVENFYLMMQSRPKERYLLGLLIPLAVVMLFLLYQKLKRQKYRLRIAYACICVGFIFTFGKLFINSALLSKEILKESEELVSLVEKAKIDKVFLMNGTNRRIDFFHTSTNYLSSHFVNFGWLMHCPLGHLSGTGLEPVVRKMPFVMMKDDNRLLRLLQNYFKQKYKIDCEFNELAETESLKLVQIKNSSLLLNE